MEWRSRPTTAWRRHSARLNLLEAAERPIHPRCSIPGGHNMNDETEILDARQYFEEHQRAVAALPHGTIDQIADELLKANESGRMVYLFGNGGSASLASHFACDLGKGTAYCNGGKRFRVLALTDNIPTITAWANDF